MNYAQLGSSELHISAIGFGCMSLGLDDAANANLLHQALDLGINFFDTADLYDRGMNEISVGKAFKGKRDKIVLASKAGNQWRADGSGWDWNPRKEYILDCAEKSLRRLQTDCIDLYQLHGGTINDPIDETIEAFEILKTQGKIRYYGISSIRPNVIAEYIRRSSIVSVMMQYSLLDRRPEEECLDLLKKHNIGALSRGGLAQGLLAGKPAKPYLDLTKEEVQKATDAVHSLSGKDRTPAQTATRYVLRHPAVNTAVIGIRTEAQLEEIAQTILTHELTKEEMTVLQHSVRAAKYKEHRTVWKPEA
ncbi:MAG: aldo/keto reductase [Chitinophagaceae bacterium]|nr:aldo/keto reductase [Chitinophagaceae bacterium]